MFKKFFTTSIKNKIAVIGIIPVVLFTLAIFSFLLPRVGDLTEDLIDNNLTAKLEGDINSAHLYLQEHFGDISLQNNELVDEQGQPIEGRHGMVDEISEDLGIVSTIFIREDEDFRRITTSITEDGERVVGTYLGEDSAAYAPVMDGELYIGEADILGEPYLTAYDPLHENGELVGILFIGIPRAEADMIANEGIAATRNYSIISTVFAVLLSAAAIIFISKPIVKNIESLTNIIGQADLSAELPEHALNQEDELGKLARGFNEMKNSLREAFSKTKESTDKVHSSSESLASSSEEINASLEEVSSTVNEFANGAQELKENAEEMNMAGSQISEKAQEGNEAVDKAVDEIEKISGHVTSLKDEIFSLNEQNKNIGNIVDSIKNIAEQTNMLALNAAIEAARAGEEGKGFAVVAEEVRKLAEQSASSAEEITKIIQSVQAQSNSVTEKMDESANSVESGRETIKSMSEILHSINNEIGNITQKIERVTSSAQDISSGSDEISSAIEEQTATMNEVASSASELQELVNELNDAINRFKF